MQNSTRKPRMTKEDLLLLESLDQYQRKDIICDTLNAVIKDEEDLIPAYEDLRDSLYTYLPRTYIGDIMRPIISEKIRNKEELSKLSSRMRCKKIST